MSSQTQINYAKAVGIESIGGAVIFAILYLPLFLWFIRKSFVHPTHVHYTLSLFCISKQKKILIVFETLWSSNVLSTCFFLVRVVAFAMRAVLAASESTAENLNVVIADEALFSIGYFGLIYSAYNLVLDR